MILSALKIIVSGKVQGVYYRAWTESVAVELGLTGWVRNLSTGQVEILAEGPEDKLRELADRCRRGPEGAQVLGLEEDHLDATGAFPEFVILR